MKKLIIFFGYCICICVVLTKVVHAQQYDENRYRYSLFNDVAVQTNIKYGEAPVWTIPYQNTDLKMDVYTPVGDPITNRPLLIFTHAGGFLNGSKDVDDMVAICDSFARKGYVTASLAYRKGFNPLSGSSAERAVYRGIQDGRAAVRYFKEHATTYGIDTNFIYFGGMSAGGFIALHLAYMEESDRPSSTYSTSLLVNDLGCLDCAGNSYPHSAKVRAIMNYWGAIQDTNLLRAGGIPILQMHGTTDPTVPFEYGHPFGVPTLPNVFGSKWIEKRANNMGIYNEFYLSHVPSRHMLDGSDNGTWDPTPSDFWYDTLLPKTTDFLVKMTQSKPTKISVDTLYSCAGQTTQIELASDAESGYFRWLLHSEGGETEFDTHNETLEHTFTTGAYNISVVEFNEVYCSSDTLWIHVVQLPPANLIALFDTQTIDDTVIYFTNFSENAVSYLWDFGDGQTSTDFEPTHIYTENGTYTVTLSIYSELDCEFSTVQKTIVITIPEVEEPELPSTPDDPDTEPEVPIVIVSIQDIEWMKNISVFPNPFNNEIYIENTNNENFVAELYDISGKRIYDKHMMEEQSYIDTKSWANGVYLLKVSSHKGTKTFRLIKN